MGLLSIQYLGEVGSSKQNGVPPRTDVLSTSHVVQGTKPVYSVFHKYLVKTLILEEAMELKRLIKTTNESLRPYLFGKIELWNF